MGEALAGRQSETAGRLQAMGEALAGRQAESCPNGSTRSPAGSAPRSRPIPSRPSTACRPCMSGSR
jgi:hypothetical protein